MVSITLISTACYTVFHVGSSRFVKHDIGRLVTRPILLRQTLGAVTEPQIHSKDNLFTKKSSKRDINTSIKALSLLALVVQNTGLTIAMRISRINKSAHMYIPSTAVALSELLKLALSLLLRWNENRRNRRDDKTFRSMNELLSTENEIEVLSLTSFLYVIQNNLQYIATSSLPAAIYQVLVQMKIITAALFSYFFHNKPVSIAQWFSICLLTLGTILVQISAQSLKLISHVNMKVGLIAVCLSCITSALAGVTQEATLKKGQLNLWERNTQICIASVFFAVLACAKDYQSIVEKGFLHGYTPLVGLVIVLHALGGLLVSVVVKETSTIVKGFATSGSILLSCFISLVFIKDVNLNAGLITGAGLVCLATMGYNSASLLPSVVQSVYISKITESSSLVLVKNGDEDEHVKDFNAAAAQGE